MSDALYGEVLGAGALVGDWEIESLVGRGGFASVYRARDRSGTAVAVKVLHPMVAESIRNLRRFEREIEAITRLDDPRIVELLGSGYLHDGRPFLVMEWLEGEDLASRVGRLGAMTVAEVVSVAGHVGRALAAAHAAGVIHRDVKPANVIASERGGDLAIKLVDFGIAKQLDEAGRTALTTAAAVGSPAAMAPEQLRGEPVDARTDVYGLGVMLFFVASGRMPFASADLGTLERMHLSEPPPRLSLHAMVPMWLEEAIARCMAKDPADRFAGPMELVERLERSIRARDSAIEAVVALRLQVLCAGDELDERIDDALDRLERDGALVAIEAGTGICAYWRGSGPESRRRAVDTARALAGPDVAIAVARSTVELCGSVVRGGGVLELDGWPTEAGGLEIEVGL